uniref:Uncharacterized protein n=1 Tax=Cucumis melo TaxID=3656 RepID=A0A9I9D5F5_CUCME
MEQRRTRLRTREGKKKYKPKETRKERKEREREGDLPVTNGSRSETVDEGEAVAGEKRRECKQRLSTPRKPAL